MPKVAWGHPNQLVHLVPRVERSAAPEVCWGTESVAKLVLPHDLHVCCLESIMSWLVSSDRVLWQGHYHDPFSLISEKLVTLLVNHGG